MIEHLFTPLISQRFLLEERYRNGHLRVINALSDTVILGVHIPRLKKLAKENFSHLAPSPINVVLEYSHPPLSQRIAKVKKG